MYLDNKSPQWSSSGTYSSVSPAEITIDEDTHQVEDYIKTLNDERKRLIENDDLLDLSRIAFPKRKYPTNTHKKIVPLMLHARKYVSKKDMDKSIVVCHEPEAKPESGMKSLDTYEKNQAKPIKFKQYYPNHDLQKRPNFRF